jgi:hypothetical protein
LFALALFFQQPNIQQLDQLAKNHDAAGLAQFLAKPYARNPFSVIKTGGAYAAGGLGWTAKSLTTPDGADYIVFSTPIIAEDMGELLFRVDKAGKLTYVPESDNLGVDLDKHNFDISFDLPAHKLVATDQIECHWAGTPGKHFVFRISPTYTVRSMVDTLGKAVPFVQAGGIVAVTPGSRPLRFKVSYDGTNKMPAFDRVISDKEATLSASVWYLTIARHPAPYDSTIHCPKDWTALAQGDLVSTTIVGDERVTKFHNPVPVVWYSATAGPYKTVVDTINGREYQTMSQTLTKDQMKEQNLYNAEVVEFYSKSFMPYPFKRWTSLDSWQFHGGPGALEAYSFATYPGGLPGQDSHEPSHTWWGGILDNDYLQSLWNESFADYCTGLFSRNRVNGNKEELAKAFVAGQFANAAYNAAPLSDSGVEIGQAAAALGYGKGADVLQMLESEIGTDTMIKCMSTWIKTNPSRHIGRWEDFEKVVDKVTGKDYTWFFDEWVRRPGYADFSLSDVTYANGQLSGKLTFKGDPYRIHADILLRMPDGTDHYDRIDTMEKNDGNSYDFSVSCPSKPALVSIDPWGKILRPRGREESPISLEQAFFSYSIFVDPAHSDYLAKVQRKVVTTLPNDLSNNLLIGSPETLPAMKPLCDAAGFKISGNVLTYEGTSIDLTKGGAAAIVDLPNGNQCAIGLGKCGHLPDTGRARLALFDDLGRPIRVKTDPVTAGLLSYRFP